MGIQESVWKNIILSAIVFSLAIFILKIISPLNPFSYYVIINLCIVIILNRPKKYQDAVFIGLFIGIITGIIISILYMTPMVFALIIFTIISIIAALISYFIFEKIIK